jgi:hypothetical protein
VTHFRLILALASDLSQALFDTKRMCGVSRAMCSSIQRAHMLAYARARHER